MSRQELVYRDVLPHLSLENEADWLFAWRTNRRDAVTLDKEQQARPADRSRAAPDSA